MKTLSMLKPGDRLEEAEWRTITQDAINRFADATGDHQWIHIDPERCERESPFGTTIAHGFMTASLMPCAFDNVVAPDPTIAQVINYGLDTLRFLEPVKCNDAIRFSFVLEEIKEKKLGMLYRMKADCINQRTGNPVLTGQFLMLAVPKPA
tara:strand:+ start:195 stop:647 length:453 start_codon:yes stop_codon:yes gene_type:complete